MKVRGLAVHDRFCWVRIEPLFFEVVAVRLRLRHYSRTTLHLCSSQLEKYLPPRTRASAIHHTLRQQIGNRSPYRCGDADHRPKAFSLAPARLPAARAELSPTANNVQREATGAAVGGEASAARAGHVPRGGQPGAAGARASERARADAVERRDEGPHGVSVRR